MPARRAPSCHRRGTPLVRLAQVPRFWRLRRGDERRRSSTRCLTRAQARQRRRSPPTSRLERRARPPRASWRRRRRLKAKRTDSRRSQARHPTHRRRQRQRAPPRRYLLLDDSDDADSDADSDDSGGDIVAVVRDSKRKGERSENLGGVGRRARASSRRASASTAPAAKSAGRPRWATLETLERRPRRRVWRERVRARVRKPPRTRRIGSTARLAHLRRSFKAGSFADAAFQALARGGVAKASTELRLAVESGTVTRVALSCSRGRRAARGGGRGTRCASSTRAPSPASAGRARRRVRRQ